MLAGQNIYPCRYINIGYRSERRTHQEKMEKIRHLFDPSASQLVGQSASRPVRSNLRTRTAKIDRYGSSCKLIQIT